MRASDSDRLVPIHIKSTLGIAVQRMNQTLRALFPVWHTIQTQMLRNPNLLERRHLTCNDGGQRIIQLPVFGMVGHSRASWNFLKHVLGRWIQKVSGHGDFSEYHQRFGHPPEAIKTCMCGQVVRRGHLGVCPIVTRGNVCQEAFLRAQEFSCK